MVCLVIRMFQSSFFHPHPPSAGIRSSFYRLPANRHGPVSLRYRNRTEITVLMCERKPFQGRFCAGARAMEPWRFLSLNFDRITSQMVPSTSSVEPRCNEGTRGLQNRFAITRFRYLEVHFHIFYYYWGKENRSLHQGLCYIGVRYI